MDEAQFKRLATRARLLQSEYGSGYSSGLRRHYHGESFGDPGEHAAKLAKQDEYGRGYRDGLDGREPEPPRGRPLRDGESRSARVEWRTLESRKARAQEMAEAAGVSLSVWLDQLVDQASERRQGDS